MVIWDFGNNRAGGQLGYTPPVSIVGSWQHFACVASKSGDCMKIYRNGILEAQKTGMTPFESTDYDVALGGEPGEAFSGSLAEFRIWSVALTQEQIQQNMHRKLGMQKGLVACWHLSEGTGLLAKDSSCNGYFGTLVNGPAWAGSNCSAGVLLNDIWLKLALSDAGIAGRVATERARPARRCSFW